VAAAAFTAASYWEAATISYVMICAALGVPWGVWRAWRSFSPRSVTAWVFTAYLMLALRKAGEYSYGVGYREIPWAVQLQGFSILIAVVIALAQALEGVFSKPDGIAPR